MSAPGFDTSGSPPSRALRGACGIGRGSEGGVVGRAGERGYYGKRFVARRGGRLRRRTWRNPHGLIVDDSLTFNCYFRVALAPSPLPTDSTTTNSCFHRARGAPQIFSALPPSECYRGLESQQTKEIESGRDPSAGSPANVTARAVSHSRTLVFGRKESQNPVAEHLRR